MSDCEHEITAKCRFLDFGESIVTLYWTSPLVSNTQSQVRGNSSLFWAEEAAWGCPAPPPPNWLLAATLLPSPSCRLLTHCERSTDRAQWLQLQPRAPSCTEEHWPNTRLLPERYEQQLHAVLWHVVPLTTHVGPHNAVLAQHTCLMYHKNTNWLPTEIREENMHSYSSANYDLLTANFIPTAIAPKAAS